MKDKLQQIREKAIAEIEGSDGLERLNEVRQAVLGKKGELTAVLRGMGGLSPEERPVIGELVNEAKESLEKLIEEKCMDVQALDVLISMEKDLETRTVLMELKNKKMETSSAYSFEDF